MAFKPWYQPSWRTGIGQKKPPVFKPFTPYSTPSPPTGSYDPALNAQLGASERGLLDVEQDTGFANERATVDYGLDRGDVERQTARSLDDLGRARTRGLEDYGIQTTALQRAYSQLQRRQNEGMRHAGVLSGGIALQAAAKRAENQGIEQGALDLSRGRFLMDNGLARDRTSEDSQNALGRLDLSYQRGGIDRTTQLTRAEREGSQFGLDVEEMKAFQAAQSGYVPPPAPKNQGVNRNGVAYREIRRGGVIYRVDRNGKVLSKRRA